MTVLLYIHSLLRWLVVISMLSSIFVSLYRYRKNCRFDRKSNILRHWTATFAHIQLVIGVLLAIQSPHFNFFWKNIQVAWSNTESIFYGLIHPISMLISVILITIGSAKAKRKKQDHDKFKTILIWFSIAALLLLIAIPWPFSPFSARVLIPNY